MKLFLFSRLIWNVTPLFPTLLINTDDIKIQILSGKTPHNSFMKLLENQLQQRYW